MKNDIAKLELKNKSNKIFGIGMPKTGTCSLNKALQILGYRSFHYPLAYVYSNSLSIPASLWEESIVRRQFSLSEDNELSGKMVEMGNLNFGQWDALSNFGEHIYPLLDKEFFNSKFILTVRNKKDWLESTKNHFIRMPTFEEDHSPAGGILRLIMRVHIYGYALYNEEYFSILYDNHIRNVKYYFKDREKDLLIMDICDGSGWEKLCPFLDKDIPKDLFPHRNTAFQIMEKNKENNCYEI